MSSTHCDQEKVDTTDLASVAAEVGMLATKGARGSRTRAGRAGRTIVTRKVFTEGLGVRPWESLALLWTRHQDARLNWWEVHAPYIDN